LLLHINIRTLKRKYNRFDKLIRLFQGANKITYSTYLVFLSFELAVVSLLVRSQIVLFHSLLPFIFYYRLVFGDRGLLKPFSLILPQQSLIIPIQLCFYFQFFKKIYLNSKQLINQKYYYLYKYIN
jgi:hypothetical protein